MSRPFSRIAAVLCRWRPMTQRSSVVLPAPFRPTSVTSSPSPTCSGTSRSAWASPYRAESPSTSRTGLGMRLPQVRGHDRGVLPNHGVAALRDHPPLLQDDHLVGELGDHTHVVLDEHDGPAGVRFSYQVDRAPDILDSHARGRFVEQEQTRVERDRKGELERALLPVGQLSSRAIREVGETDLREELARSHSIALERTLGGPETVPDGRRRLKRELGVLESGELIEQTRDLKGARDPAPRDAFGRQPRGVGAEDDHATSGRSQEAGQEIEETRLPGAVGTDERMHLTDLETQIHAVDGTEAGELFDEPLGLDGVGRGDDAHIRVLRPAQYGSRMTRFSVFPAALRGKSRTTTTSCTC